MVAGLSDLRDEPNDLLSSSTLLVAGEPFQALCDVFLQLWDPSAYQPIAIFLTLNLVQFLLLGSTGPHRHSLRRGGKGRRNVPCQKQLRNLQSKSK